MTWTAGTMVNEEIRLVRPLGAANANAWIADQLDWKRQVVVKRLPAPERADDPDAVFGLLERVAGAQIEHPHLVQLFNQGLSDDGVPYVLMELLAGESLAERLSKGRLPLDEATTVLRQLGGVLGAIHAAGQIHTAVEPAHVMLCRAPSGSQVKLLNLGIAAMRPRGRTWAYISPEQYLDRALGPATDRWSLAVCAYEMLSGQLPTTPENRRKHRWDPAPLGEHWLSDVPESLDPWFARALKPRPEQRFGAMAEMLAAFDAALAAGAIRPPSAPPSGAPAPSVHEHAIITVGTPAPAPPKPVEDDSVFVIEVDD